MDSEQIKAKTITWQAINRGLKNLNHLKTREGFRNSLKEELMKRVMLEKLEASRVFGFGWYGNLFTLRLLKRAYAPVALGIFIFLGSTGLAMKAAGDSLPGEFLYRVKRATEGAQVSLSLSQASKVKKEVNFAGKRVEELARLTEIPAAEPENDGRAGAKETTKPVEPEVIKKTVQDFHKEIDNVKIRLESLNKKGDDEAVATAKVIDKKTEELASTLNQVALQQELTPEIKEKIAKAIYALDEVSSQALGVVIREKIDIESEEMGALVKRLEDKILATEGRIANVDKIIEGEGLVGDSQGILLSLEKKIELAKIILTEARESLIERNLEMTLEKVEKSKELAAEVRTELVSGAQKNTIREQADTRATASSEDKSSGDKKESKGVSEGAEKPDNTDISGEPLEKENEKEGLIEGQQIDNTDNNNQNGTTEESGKEIRAKLIVE